jgi:hypothetical protein
MTVSLYAQKAHCCGEALRECACASKVCKKVARSAQDAI